MRKNHLIYPHYPEGMKQLDKLDRRVLFELDLNSRRSCSELAKRLKQGRDRVSYRLARLEDRKIIRRCTAIVNLHKLGFTLYKSYLRLENDRARISEMIEYLRRHPRVYWIAKCDGGWDLMLAVFAKDAQEFYTIHSQIVTRFNEIVLNFGMYTLVQVRMFRKGFLLGKSGGHFTIGGEAAGERVDELDYEILRVLCEDSRTSVTDLASRTKSTPSVVGYRIQKLEERGIIPGYNIEVDLDELDMLFFKTQFYLRNYTSQLREEFFEYCSENPYVSCFVEQLGDSNLEIELHVHDYEHYNEIIDEIRGRFSKLVRNFQTIMVRKAYFNWMPRDL